MTALLIVLLIAAVAGMLRHGQRSLRWMVDDAETDAFLAEIRRVTPPPARITGLVTRHAPVPGLSAAIEAALKRQMGKQRAQEGSS